MIDLTYFEARDDFRRKAKVAGARLHELPIAARGPQGEGLTTDIAVLGSSSPKRVLLHSAGVHGVEGYAGSAIQRAILEGSPTPPADQAILFIHAVNPFGMSWRRRWNEESIDLNRNVLAAGESYSGAPPLYADLDSFLNPASPPELIDLYYLWAAWLVLRHGLTTVQQAVAQGQYEYPRGLFFGGKSLAESPRQIIEFLRPIVCGAEEVFQIDVHTGLGLYGEDVLLLEERTESPAVSELKAALGPRIMAVDHPLSYEVRGSFPSGLAAHLPGPKWQHVTQEFGTYNPVYVLSCLREENRWHHYGGSPEDWKHPVKQRVLETFVPADAKWQEKVIQRGKTLFRDAMEMLATGK
jgi:hypothetical protein